MSGLDGKVALITGAGGMRGVGRATALKLAQQGVDLALTDVHREPECLPPGEIRLGWRGLDSVAEEVQALGRLCFTGPCDLGQSDRGPTAGPAGGRTLMVASICWSTTHGPSSARE